ncbi:hypothetical protein CMO88_01250 [Candidatus Woesearchaeota archaeon]|mgnify:CR=1 FL=1|nr:hypothetical protein [Candidatus Woesearchaeota archaeon]|tara:strand:+ start:2400 stop:4931 length:2532 start_codon:yes stop_codon:yes gene_type:complete
MKKTVSSFLLVTLVFISTLFLINFALADFYELVSPSNNTFANQQNNNFTVNASFTRNNSLTNVSLWLSQAGTLSINSTNQSAVANNSLQNFSLILNEGKYNWTFSITLNSTDTLINDTNYTLTVDLTYPNVSLLLPAAGNYSNELLFNSSANDSLSGVVNVSYGYEKPGSAIAWISDGTSVTAWNATLDTTGVADGKWNITVNATDEAGNQNVTVNITEIIIDNNVPNGTILIPINNSNISSSVYINTSVNDSGTGVMAVAIGYQNTSSSLTWVNATEDGSGGWNATINISNFVETVYNLSINTTDFRGNSTVKYNITFFTFDTTPPKLAPTAVFANTSRNNGNINITWTEPSDETAESYIVYRFRSNITTFNKSLTNITANRVPEGTGFFLDNGTTGDNRSFYWYSVVAVDNAGNLNTSNGAANLSLNAINVSVNDSVMPKSPANLNYSATNAGGITLHWLNVTQDVPGDPDGYNITFRVYRSNANVVVNLSKYSYVNLSDTNAGITRQIGEVITTNSTSFSVTANGSYIFVVTSVDDNGNENKSHDNSVSSPNILNVTISITSDGSDDDSSSSSSGSGGGSGGSGGAAADPNAGVSQSRSWDVIDAGATATFKVTKTGIPITSLKFKVTEKVEDVEITVTKLSKKPSNVKTDYGGKVYNYISIVKPNLKDTAISSATIDFKVEKKWLESNSASSSDVVFLRYNRNEWNELSVKHVKSDDTHYFYEAESPGFSTFIIGLKEVETAASLNESGESDTGTSDDGTIEDNETGSPEDEKTQKGKALLYTAIAIIAIAVIGGALGFFYYRKSKGALGSSEDSDSDDSEEEEEKPKEDKNKSKDENT